MAQQEGSSTVLIYKAEVTYNTVPHNDVDAMVLPFVSESVRLSRNLISSRTIRSSRNPLAPVRGNVDVAGDVTFELAHQYGKMLHLALGTYAAVSGESVGLAVGTYRHTFTIGTLPSFAIEKQFPDLDTAKYFQYTGCKVNSLKVSVKSEGMIECSASFMGADETVANSTFAASAVDLGHQPFDGFEAVIAEGGATLATASTVDFTIENNLDGNSYVIDGTGKRHSIPVGTAKVSGTIAVLFENVTLYNKAIANDESSLIVVLTKGTGVGTAGNEKLTFTIGELIFQPNTPGISGPLGILVELPFEAYYDNDAAASALKVVLDSTRPHYG